MQATGGRAIDQPRTTPEFARHSRHWRDNRYVYPVISRRSRGLSIGVNLNPDTVCNFDCIYCQVDRTKTPAVRRVELPVLQEELDHLADLAASGEIFEDPLFTSVPSSLRRVNDLAFSGDGEPTTCPQFADAVRLAAEARTRHRLESARIVLITNACYLTRPKVIAGLEIMDENNGEIWAKLDAGTEEYFRRVNQPNFSLQHVVENITAAARVRPVCIQSLWLRTDGQAAPVEEVDAFVDRLGEITAAGGAIRLVQVYTVARATAQPGVTALSDAELTALADRVADRSGLPVASFPAGV